MQKRGQVGLARPKLGFEGHTSHPCVLWKTHSRFRKELGMPGPEARRPRRPSRPADPKDYSPQNAARPSARPGARAWWRSRALTGAEPRESEQGWHRGGDGARRWGSWTSPAGQVSAEREAGGDPLGLQGPAPTHAPLVETRGLWRDRLTHGLADGRAEKPGGAAARAGRALARQAHRVGV
ncbi:unnamed protein product [Rangifer tarandus platyrhynchus]|uniref:Uncharacterized protein n=2 Tax=Rangifer tarandus platyrhynchus TaxID=3082113 RepID=A0ABN8YX61_RANTA|nr:unnamed protein product [Rangifer tarandus platyrhynchus]CAI9693834.1 unnamed protein product [Rangifer tarandus platyrhynchus]